MIDPFARPVAAIDHDLHEQVERRDKAMTNLLHALFVIERATGSIDRLLAERGNAAKREKAEPVGSAG